MINFYEPIAIKTAEGLFPAVVVKHMTCSCVVYDDDANDYWFANEAGELFVEFGIDKLIRKSVVNVRLVEIAHEDTLELPTASPTSCASPRWLSPWHTTYWPFGCGDRTQRSPTASASIRINGHSFRSSSACWPGTGFGARRHIMKSTINHGHDEPCMQSRLLSGSVEKIHECMTDDILDAIEPHMLVLEELVGTTKATRIFETLLMRMLTGLLTVSEVPEDSVEWQECQRRVKAIHETAAEWLHNMYCDFVPTVLEQPADTDDDYVCASAYTRLINIQDKE